MHNLIGGSASSKPPLIIGSLEPEEDDAGGPLQQELEENASDTSHQDDSSRDDPQAPLAQKKNWLRRKRRWREGGMLAFLKSQALKEEAWEACSKLMVFGFVFPSWLRKINECFTFIWISVVPKAHLVGRGVLHFLFLSKHFQI